MERLELESPLTPAAIIDALTAVQKEWRESRQVVAIEGRPDSRFRIRLRDRRFQIVVRAGKDSRATLVCEGEVTSAGTGGRVHARIRRSYRDVVGDVISTVLGVWICWSTQSFVGILIIMLFGLPSLVRHERTGDQRVALRTLLGRLVETKQGELSAALPNERCICRSGGHQVVRPLGALYHLLIVARGRGLRS